MNPATAPCVGNRPHTRGRLHWKGCSHNVHSRLVCRVLAPPEAPGRRPRSASVDVSQTPSTAAPQTDFWSSTTSFASQLLSHFRVPAFAAATPDAVLREASTKERELQSAKAPLDVSAFLSPVGVWELKHIRKLSSLTGLTYYMHLVTPRRLMRMHGLELVATSRACDIRPYEHNKTAEEVGADGDGMAVSVNDAREVYQALKRDGRAAAVGPAGPGPGLPGSSNIVSLAREVPYEVVSPPGQQEAAPSVWAGFGGGGGSGGGGGGPSWPVPPSVMGPAATSGATGGPQQPQPPSSSGSSGGAAATSPAPNALPKLLRTPAEIVAAKLAEAAAAASAAASATPAATALASAAESLYAGLASLPIGGALVGANSRPANALPQAAATPLTSTAASMDDAAAAAAGAAPQRPATSSRRGADGGGSGAAAAAASATAAGVTGGVGGHKATAASIAAMANEQIRQQTLRSLGFGLTRSNGNGGGMAAVGASGLMQSSAPATAAAAALLASQPDAASSSSSLTFSSSPSFACPSEWFVVDDPATHTRVFVIQGSDTLDHWKLNLTFDPVPFEDPALGVKVHRGVYAAALALYDRFLPLVYEHIESSPFSKIAFTGHSIGGSLATLLMLMYRCRGVLPPHSIATVYTFGAPAVFCQTHQHGGGQPGQPGGGRPTSTSPVPCPPSGSNSWVSPSLWSLGSISSSVGSASSVSSVEDPAPAPAPGTAAAATSLPAAPPGAAGPSSMTSSGPSPSAPADHSPGCACGADMMLARLHLSPQVVRNVIMARDIVPRAFTCDYSPVADILKSWGSSFKEHVCLNRHGRKHLYYFVGRMFILQPDSWHSFTTDMDHPMLPPGPELYTLTDPAHAPHPLRTAAELEAAEAAAEVQPPAPSAAAAPAQPAARAAARSVMEAVWELMDCPHPLETLADPGAYLASGSISRYHNPDNYTRALGRIVHLKRLAERRTIAGAAPAAGAEQPLPASAASTGRAGEEAAAAGAAVQWDSSDALDTVRTWGW